MTIIVIPFEDKQVVNNGIERVYDDTLEKFFDNEEAAEVYKHYLECKGMQVALAPLNVLSTIDITALQVADALAKLTETDKQLLGLT